MNENTELITPGQRGPGERRHAYQTALAVATQIMNTTPVMPTEFAVRVPAWLAAEVEVNFYFHRDPDALRRFADEFLMDVSTADREGGSVFTEARGMAGGVIVIAWSLSPAEAPVSL